MSPTELLLIAVSLAAPAFFLFFTLAALGGPLLAIFCLAAGHARRTQHPEAYARRLLRMALTCALPSLAVIIAVGALLNHRVSWFRDWLFSAPLAPSLCAVAALAYCALLLARRISGARPQRSPDNPLLQTLILAGLALVLLFLALSLARDYLAQALAVLSAPAVDGILVAALLPPALNLEDPLLLTAVLASAPLAALCAGAWSLEYLLLRREREPFGSEAFAHALRLAARCTLRSALVLACCLPLLWLRLTKRPGDLDALTPLLATSGAALLVACLLWSSLARSHRLSQASLRVHAALILVWLSLTTALAAGLLHFYAA